MDKRKIKIISSNIIENDNTQSILNPNNLDLYKTKDDKSIVMLTKYYIFNRDLKDIKVINDNNDTLKKNLKKNLKIDNQKYMLTPSVILSSESILQLYEIESIDNLIETITIYIKNNKNFNTINRILNSFIKANLDDLKKNNKIIYTIIIDLINNYYPKFKNNEKKISDYIKTWFTNKHENDFDFDLFNNIKKFLG